MGPVLSWGAPGELAGRHGVCLRTDLPDRSPQLHLVHRKLLFRPGESGAQYGHAPGSNQTWVGAAAPPAPARRSPCSIMLPFCPPVQVCACDLFTNNCTLAPSVGDEGHLPV